MARGAWLAGLLALAAVLQLGAAMYEPEDNIIAVDDETFKKEVLADSNIWLVEFYAPWCGHCKALAPEYKKVAKSLDGIVKVAAVDCDEAKEACAAAGVKSFPTIQIYPHKKEKNPYTKKTMKIAVDHTGPRTGKKIAEFATSQIPMHVNMVSTSDGSWNTFNDSPLPKVVLMTSKDETTPLYKALAVKFNKRLAFAQGKDDDEVLMGDLKVSSAPAVVVIKADGQAEAYTGAIKARALAEFLEGFAAPAPAEDEAEEASDAGKPEEKKEAKSVFTEITAEAFDGSVMQSEEPWLVLFKGAGEECVDKVAGVEGALKSIAGSVRMGAVDAAAEANKGLVKEWGAEAVSSGKLCTKLLLFPFGDDKADSDPSEFEGNEADTKELTAFLSEGLPNFVSRISGDTFDQFLGTQPMVPKLVLITSKPETPFAMKSLALKYRKSVLLADVPSTDPDVPARMGISKFPALVLAMAQPGEGDTEGKDVKFAVQQYPGPMTFLGIKAFVDQIMSALGLEGGEGGAAAPPPAAKAAIPEVDTNGGFKEACLDKGGLCVLGVFDKASDEYEAQLKVFTGVAAKLGSSGSSPFNFLTLDGARQSDFVQAFDIRSSDLPSVVMLSAKKLRYATLQSGFAEKAVLEMLQGVLNARTKTHMIQEVPALVDGGVEPVAEEEEIVEEEFSLDDIMGEEVDGALTGAADRLKAVDAEIAEEDAKRAAEEAEAAASAAKEAKDAKKKKKKKSKKKKSKDEL